MNAYFTVTETSLRRRPRFSQELVLHPQHADLSFQLLQPGTLRKGQHRLITDVLGAPGAHPVPQSLGYQTILPGNIRDRPGLLYHLPDRCLSELRRKLPTLV